MLDGWGQRVSQYHFARNLKIDSRHLSRGESGSFVASRDGRYGSKVGQIGPNWEKSGAFSDQISVHLAHRAHSSSQIH